MFPYLLILTEIVDILIRITSSAIELRIYAITTGIKKCKSIIKKMKVKHGKIVLFAKSKLNSITVLISKGLIDSGFNGEFISINNVLKEYNGMKKEMKNLKT